MRQPLLCLALLLTGACTTIPDAQPAAPEPVDLLVRNVTVIDPEQATRTPGRDVLIDNGRITAVIPSESAAHGAESVVDGTGKYLIPGLMDMHTHSSIRPVHISTLKLMAANGVTGIREMGSDCIERGKIGMCIDEMRESRAKIESGELVGPRILELSSLKIDSNRPEDADDVWKLYRPTDADQARQTVALLAAQRRPDILKIGDEFQPEAFKALLAAAREQGTKTGGHLPPMFSMAEAAAMGMTSIEHARDLPLDCSSHGAVFRGQMMAKIMGEDVPWPDRKAIPGKARDGFDEELCAAQIAALVEHGTYYVPTHLTREMDYRAGESSYREDARLAYIPAMQQGQWNPDLDRTAEAPPEMVRDLADFFRLGLKTTGMAHDAEVKIMAGTDANDTMVFPGFSLHDELRHLVAAGLTPMETLQAATSVPAEYLGRTADFGGVSEGKIADLLLLSADPTADIANTTRIEAVIFGGQLRDRAALDALLADVREWVSLADEQMKGAN